MATDATEALAARVRALLADGPDAADVDERRMFGGVAVLVGGRMAVAASGHGGLMVRGTPEDAATWQAEPGVGPVVMRGSPSRGWVLVDPDHLDDEALETWVARGVARARALAVEDGPRASRGRRAAGRAG